MKENILLLVDADGDSEGLVTEAAARTGRVVVLAMSSRKAFGILGEQMRQLDVVIVDVDPGAHGLALLEAISACAERPSIIVITALEETYMKSIARSHGAEACLGKPIAIGKLQSTIDHVSAKKSLTSDRWGSLVPPPLKNRANMKTNFRGIAAKLSPGGSPRRKQS